MMGYKYILVDGKPVDEPDIFKWMEWFENATAERFVATTKVDDAEVSTVFLGIDHKFLKQGPPVLWETMIFGGPYDRRRWRYTSREAAEAHHQKIVAAFKERKGPPDPE